MMLHPSPEEIDFLRKRHNAAPDDDVTFRACPFCAFPSWCSTNHAGTGRTLVTLDEGRLCGACDEARRLHPAVFEMIVIGLRGIDVLRRWARDEPDAPTG